jgi:hypothetical protein
MKIRNYISIAVIYTLAVSLIGCAKKPCSWNGEVNGVPFEITTSEAKFDGVFLSIDARQEAPFLAHINMVLFVDGPGNYTCNEGTYFFHNRKLKIKGNTAYYNISAKPNPIFHHTNSQNIGTVVITSLDADDKVVSGTFQFRLAERETGSSEVNLKGSFENVPMEVNWNEYGTSDQ